MKPKYQIEVTDWKLIPQSMMVMVVNAICAKKYLEKDDAYKAGRDAFPDDGWKVVAVEDAD